jgi:uncharacterized protein YndB with AHSA1/START domain
MSELLIKNTITIKAAAQAVWQALVDPAYTKQYMFGCETVSDWKAGSSLLWQMDYEGKELIAVKGTVLEIIPGKKLVYTVFNPNNKSMEDVPENYLTVTYDLENAGNETILNVTQGDYNKVADGEIRYKESYNNGEGWSPILVKIKKLVEEGK